MICIFFLSCLVHKLSDDHEFVAHESPYIVALGYTFKRPVMCLQVKLLMIFSTLITVLLVKILML